jgi:transposase
MKLEQQRTRNEIIVNMSKQGYPQSAIAKAVGLRQSRISQLLNAYHKSPDSFLDNRYQGKPPKLDADQASKLKGLIEAGAESYGFQGDVWTGARVQLAIKETFGVSYHVHHVPKLLEGMGFSLQKPRSVDSRQSPEKIEGWRSGTLPAIKKKPSKRGV